MIRYLRSLNKNDDDIIKELKKIKFSEIECLGEDCTSYIYEKLLRKASSFNYIKDIKVNIYKSELEIINNLKDEDTKDILFLLLVYYKWALNVEHLSINNSKYQIVQSSDMEIFKLANLLKLRKNKRNEIFNFLFNNGLYISNVFKSKEYYSIPFCEKVGIPEFTICDYDNLLFYLKKYNDKDSYFNCFECNKIVKKKSNSQKYCSNCAKINKIKSTVENRKSKITL